MRQTVQPQRHPWGHESGSGMNRTWLDARIVQRSITHAKKMSWSRLQKVAMTKIESNVKRITQRP
jgi:hypothetical protein